MKILITGDLVLKEEYNVSKVDTSLISLFEHSNYNIVNLEAPITVSKFAIDKTGPNIKSNEKSTQDVLKALKVNLVTLGNNHILDYGEQGVADTLEFCKNNGIKTVGAGMNLKEASEVFYLTTDEGKLAIVNFAENEWTSATTISAGSNPMDIIDNTKQISVAKENADFVIVIIHGGNEYNDYPSPRMVKQYRYYADCGADIVIGHHTHCISGYEIYDETPILYSLGNFLFTKNSKKDAWYTGMVASLEIKRGKSINFQLIPVRQSKSEYKLFIPSEDESIKIFNKINKINQAIGDPVLLENKWQEFIKSVQPGFIKTITPMAGVNNRYLKAILYRTGMYKWFLNQKYLKESLNRIRCEAHRDVTKEILRSFIKK